MCSISVTCSGAGAIDTRLIKTPLRSHEIGPTFVRCHLPATNDHAEQGEAVASVVLHAKREPNRG